MGDAACDARDLHAVLEARGIAPVIAHNPRRCGPRPWQWAVNFVVRSVRPRIKPVYSPLKRAHGLAWARSFSFVRNRVDATFRVMAFDRYRVVGLLEHAT